MLGTQAEEDGEPEVLAATGAAPFGVPTRVPVRSRIASMRG
jgi:hypothetical protein